MQPKFSVGDIVEVKSSNIHTYYTEGNDVGLIGEIVDIHVEGDFLVEFDKAYDFTHDGNCRGFGIGKRRYYSPAHLAFAKTDLVRIKNDSFCEIVQNRVVRIGRNRPRNRIERE